MNVTKQPPVPVEPWAPETIDAFEHTPTCIRPDIQPFSDDAPQSEDCLSLNVFVPGIDFVYRQIYTSEQESSDATLIE